MSSTYNWTDCFSSFLKFQVVRPGVDACGVDAGDALQVIETGERPLLVAVGNDALRIGDGNVEKPRQSVAGARLMKMRPPGLNVAARYSTMAARSSVPDAPGHDISLCYTGRVSLFRVKRDRPQSEG